MRMKLRWALAPLAVLALAACGDKAGETTAEKTATPSATPLAATVKADNGHAALSTVIANAGMETALDGVGPYTLFAPPDAALKGGAGGANFTDPTLKAEAAALVRSHIVPGAITRADIAAAVDKSAGKGAQMRTMDGVLITFTKDGDAIMATSPDGAAVRLTGKEALVSNGVLQPVDALLVRPAPAAG